MILKCGFQNVIAQTAAMVYCIATLFVVGRSWLPIMQRTLHCDPLYKLYFSNPEV